VAGRSWGLCWLCWAWCPCWCMAVMGRHGTSLVRTWAGGGALSRALRVRGVEHGPIVRRGGGGGRRGGERRALHDPIGLTIVRGAPHDPIVLTIVAKEVRGEGEGGGNACSGGAHRWRVSEGGGAQSARRGSLDSLPGGLGGSGEAGGWRRPSFPLFINNAVYVATINGACIVAPRIRLTRDYVASMSIMTWWPMRRGIAPSLQQ